MTINDAKKVMLDKVNLEIESLELSEEIRTKEKQVKNLNMDVKEAEYSYNELENSAVKQFFLSITGKKEVRLQEAQNEVRRTRAELASAEFEMTSLKTKSEEIEQTRNEIENVCFECLNTIAEVDGEEVKANICTIVEVPRLCAEISAHLKKMKLIFANAHNVYFVGEPTASCLDGNANNISKAMRKQCKIVAASVDEIIELLNTYNQYALEEIKIDFYDKWMDDAEYWENQLLPVDSLERIEKVEGWFRSLDNSWSVMRKQQKEVLQRLQEEVLAYLDD